MKTTEEWLRSLFDRKVTDISRLASPFQWTLVDTAKCEVTDNWNDFADNHRQRAAYTRVIIADEDRWIHLWLDVTDPSMLTMSQWDVMIPWIRVRFIIWNRQPLLEELLPYTDYPLDGTRGEVWNRKGLDSFLGLR